MATSGQTLWCDTCAIAYEVAEIPPGHRFACVRCHETLHVEPGPDSGTTWLYTARRSGAAAPTADDARTTWVDAPSPAPTAPPKRLGRYELGDEIGRGGMGVVYRAWDPGGARWVALKLLIGGRFADRTSVERFLRETAAASRLDHPSLVRVLDSGEIQGQVFLAMELIEGPSLRDVLDDIGRPPLEEALRIGACLARALAHAHVAGVAHRDVKPENVLLTTEGRPVLTDFGLVIEHSHARLTHTGQVMGTPAYLAPELARGEKEPDWASVDIYALGAVLYEIVSGRPAYEGDTGMQILMDVLEAAPPGPRSVDPKIPPEVAVIVERAMARVPSERYPDAGSLADDLERAGRGEPIRARPLSAGYHLREWTRRNGRVITGAAAAVVALSAIGVTLYGARGRMELAERNAAWQQAHTRLYELQAQWTRAEEEGRRAEVDAAVEAFVADDAWRDAPAVSEALRLHGNRVAARGDADGSLELLARAWVSAPTGPAADLALDSLEAALVARWRYDRIETLAAARTNPDRADPMRAQAAVARRDLAAARAAWAQLPPTSVTVAPVVEQMLRGRETPHHTRAGRALAGGGVLLMRPGSRDAVAVDPQGGEIGVWDFGRQAEQMFPIGEDAVLTWAAERAEIRQRAGGGWTTAYAWDDSRVLDVVPWISADDARTLLVGVGPYSRHLLRLDWIDGAWRRRPAHPGTDLAASDVVALEVADLDADGTSEIAAAVGPWNAFDVRLFEPADDGSLELVARRKIGHVADVEALAWRGRTLLAVAKDDQNPSRRVFSKAAPYGEPPGLYLLDPTDSLRTVAWYPVDPPTGARPTALDGVFAADLDGDQLPDLAVNATTDDARRWLLVYRQDADGRLHGARIGGIHAIAAVQSDADPALELVVTMGDRDEDKPYPVWILGLGDTPLPAHPRVVAPTRPTPDGIAPGDAEAWRRAEHLASAGLAAPAASAFARIAARVDRPEIADGARVRAAELWLDAGEPMRAADSAVRATGGHLRAQALDTRARALVRAYRFADAARSDDELAALPTRPPDVDRALAERRALYAENAAPATTVVTFDAPMDPRWRVATPLALSRDPRAGALNVDVVVGTGDVARLPLVRVGDVASIQVVGTLRRLEWASGVEIGVIPEGEGDGLGIRAAGWGGGALLERQLGCSIGHRGLLGPRVPVEPDQVQPIVARLEIAPRLHEATCRIEDGSGHVLSEARFAFDDPIRTERWDLAIRSHGEEAVATPMHARFTVSRISLEGFAVDPDAPPGNAASLALAQGDVAGALASMDPAPSWLRTVALAESGALVDARAAVPADDAEDTSLPLILRSRPEIALALRPALADAWFPAWHGAWNVAAVSHPDDPRIHARLRTDLEGLDRWGPTDPDLRAVWMELLALRGRAWWLDGRGAAARADLEQAATLALEVMAEAERAGDGPRLQSGRLAWMDAHVTLAAIAISDDDLDQARAHATRAFDHAPSRELALDRLLLDPRIAARREALGLGPPTPAPSEAGR